METDQLLAVGTADLFRWLCAHESNGIMKMFRRIKMTLFSQKLITNHHLLPWCAWTTCFYM